MGIFQASAKKANWKQYAMLSAVKVLLCGGLLEGTSNVQGNLTILERESAAGVKIKLSHSSVTRYCNDVGGCERSGCYSDDWKRKQEKLTSRPLTVEHEKSHDNTILVFCGNETGCSGKKEM